MGKGAKWLPTPSSSDYRVDRKCAGKCQDPKPALGLMALGARQTSVDLGQRQRSFGAHARFSRT